MRWFCVHPALPDNATLRVRAHPSSDAPELGLRMPKGRAIAVVAPEFEAAAASEDEVHRWVRVVVPDTDTGAERSGFMMARLPDGTELLTSWHKAGFRSCCRVDNPKAFLFDGPTATANVVGLVDSTELAYGILEVDGSRALIQHSEHERVWIDTKELDPVSLPLHHSDCSVAHSFYTLNDALPPEAQIAIRSFPSKEAETVGLLSRGDLLEVSFRSGCWLQIATADGGDAFWIMWTTDSVQLLVEVPDHGSSRCMPFGGSPASDDISGVNGVQDAVAVAAQVRGDDADADYDTLVGNRDRNSPLDEEMTHKVAQDEDEVDASEAVCPPLDEELMLNEDSTTPDPLPVDGSICETAASEAADSTDVETPTASDFSRRALLNDDTADAAASVPGSISQPKASWEDRPIKPARQQQFSWDDRPTQQSRVDRNAIEPTAPAGCGTGVASSKTISTADASSAVSLDDERQIPPVQACDVGQGAHESVTGDVDMSADNDGDQEEITDPGERPIEPHDYAADERPIRPAASATVQVGDLPTAAAIFNPDDRSIDLSTVGFDIDTSIGRTEQFDVDAGEGNAPHMTEQQVSPRLDNRPVRPARQQAWDERPIQPAQYVGDVDTGASNQALAAVVATAPGERPIRPAPVKEDADMATADSIDIVINATVDSNFEGESYQASLHPDERPIKPAQHRYAWDERPIRPAASAGNFEDGADRERILAHPDERPIRPARHQNAWDEDPKHSVAANMVLETDVSMAAKPDVSLQNDTVQAPEEEPSSHRDERPLQPTQQTFAWDERPVHQARRNNGIEERLAHTDALYVHYPSEAASDDGEHSISQPQEDAIVDMGSAFDNEANDAVEEMESEDVAEDSGAAGHEVIEHETFHLADRPIRPAQTQPAWDDRPIKSSQQNYSWDEMPILPASEDVEMEVHSADEIDASDLLPHEAGHDQVMSGHCTNRSATPSRRALVEEQLDVDSADRDLEAEDTASVNDAADSDSTRVLAETNAMAQHSDSLDAELEGDGYSFLTRYGVAAYCNWKKRSMASLDELSQIQYDAMVEGDVDILLEALAYDVDLADEWMLRMPLDEASVDILYDRAQNGHAAKPPMAPLSPDSARKAKLKALFQRLPESGASASVFSVIMGGGSGDSIIEAEVADDDSDFALMSQFKYPTRPRRGRGGTPGRHLGRHEWSSMPVAIGLRRAASTSSVAPPPVNGNSEAASAPKPTASAPKPTASASVTVSQPVDRVPSTPDAKSNPLKRPAASIAKTPPPVRPSREPQVSTAAPAAASAAPSAEVSFTRQATQDEAKAPSVPARGLTPRSSIALPSSSAVRKTPASSLPAPSLNRPRPLASRLSAPSSISSVAQRAGSLPQPSSISRSALPTWSLSTTAGSGIPASVAGSGGPSLLPRRSMLPTPMKPSGLQAPATRTIAQQTTSSTSEARRATFGFARSRPTTISKPTK